MESSALRYLNENYEFLVSAKGVNDTMDKFMEMAKKMEQMSPEEKKQVMMKNRSMCICSGCPTYTSCMKEKNELLFCSMGKAHAASR